MGLRKMLLRIGINWRNKYSRTVQRTETKWEPLVPADLNALQTFIHMTYIWTKDSLLDNIQSIQHMNWQLEHTGKIRGDCDDLATYSSYLLLRMKYTQVIRVNIWEERHVICAFSISNGWQVVDNRKMHPPYYGSLHKSILQRSEYDELVTISEHMSLPIP